LKIARQDSSFFSTQNRESFGPNPSKIVPALESAEICKKHEATNVAFDNSLNKLVCNSCIYENENYETLKYSALMS
jgi:hypothetical protein